MTDRLPTRCNGLEALVFPQHGDWFALRVSIDGGGVHQGRLTQSGRRLDYASEGREFCQGTFKNGYPERREMSDRGFLRRSHCRRFRPPRHQRSRPILLAITDSGSGRGGRASWA